MDSQEKALFPQSALKEPAKKAYATKQEVLERVKEIAQPDLSSQQKSNHQLDSLLAFAGGDEEAAKEILDTVKQELAAHLENLKEAVEEESLSTDRIGKAAHKLLPIATMMQMGCLEELKTLSPEHIGKIEEAEIRAKLQVVITTLSAAVSDLYAS